MIPLTETFQIDMEFLAEQRPHRTRNEGLLLEYTPPADAYNLQKMQRFITEFVSNAVDYRTDPAELPVFGLEIHYSDDKIRYLLYLSDASLMRPLINRLDVDFGGGLSRLEPQTPNGGKWFVPIREDDHVAAAEMHLKHHFYEPLRSYKTSHSSADDFKSPYPNVFQQMVDERDTREVIQILFKPYGVNWTDATLRSLEGRADAVEGRQTTSRSRLFDLDSGYFNVEDDVSVPDNVQKSIRDIKSQQGKVGYFTNVRFAAISSDANVARSQLQHITAEFKQKYRDPGTGQTLLPIIQRGADIEDLILNMIDRRPKYMEWPSLSRAAARPARGYCETTLITPEELVSLAHFVSKSHDYTNSLTWATTGRSEQLPPDYASHYKEYYAEGKERRKPWKETTNDWSEEERQQQSEEVYIEGDVEEQFGTDES